MNETTIPERILNQANIKIQEIRAKYNWLITVVLDNRRWFRFIYDCKDIRNCNNNCSLCDLFNILKDEKDGEFTANLIKATPKDKELFGNQNFLNCKTLYQYWKCFEEFLLKECNNEEEIKDELSLIFNLKIIFPKDKLNSEIKNKFQINIIKNTLAKSNKDKKQRIKNNIPQNLKKLCL